MNPRALDLARAKRGTERSFSPILALFSCAMAFAGPVAADVLLPAEGQLLYRVHVQFEWPPLRAAERYQLQIVEDDGSRKPFETAMPVVDLDLDALRSRAVARRCVGLQRSGMPPVPRTHQA